MLAVEYQKKQSRMLLKFLSRVKAALVNIFGGIVRCDLVANGIVKAAKELGLKVPMVVRLEGTNVELGKKILEESGLSFYPAETMKEAAEKVVPLAKQ
jgi:succinyl-CoA synthetase beta subunit